MLETAVLYTCLTRVVTCGGNLSKAMAMAACVGRKVTIEVAPGATEAVDPFNLADDDCEGFVSIDRYHMLFLVSSKPVDLTVNMPSGPFETPFVLDGNSHRSASSKSGWARTAPFTFKNNHASATACFTIYLAKAE